MPPPCSSRTARLHLLAVTTAVLSLLALYGPSFLRHIREANKGYQDDVTQQVAPFLRPLQDRPQDYIDHYWLAILPPGYRALYAAGSRVLNPVTISRYLPHVLLILMILALAWGAAGLGGLGAGWAIAALVLSADTFLTRMGGGLPRAFAFPIFALALAAAVRGRIFVLCASIVLGTLFYPTVSVAGGLTLALLLLAAPARARGDAEAWSLRKRVAVLAITGLLTLLPVLITAWRLWPYGSRIGADDFANYPEAGPMGRLGGEDRVDYRQNVRRCIELSSHTVFRTAGAPWCAAAQDWLFHEPQRTIVRRLLELLVLVGGATALALGPAAWRLLAASAAAVSAYFLSIVMSPLFFLPARHITYTVPLLTLLWFVAAAAALPKLLAVLFRPLRRPLRLPAAAAVSVVAISSLSLLLVGGRIHPDIGRTMKYEPDNKLWQFVASLPHTAYIAGWPRLMDSIPFMTQRPVLVSLETHLPHHTKYVEEMRRRMNATIDAYLASSVEPLVALRDQFGVTHLVFHTAHFRGRNPPRYIVPFPRRIRTRFEQARCSFEVLRQRPCAEVLSWGKIGVLDLSKLCVSNRPPQN